MNKNKSLIILAACGLLLLSVSSAQAGGSVFAGVSLPTGDFGDTVDMGFHGGAAYSMPVAPTLSVGGMASYHTWGVADGINFFGGDDPVDVSSESFSLIEVLAFGKLTAPGGLFGMVGLGFGNLGASIEGIDSETKLTSALGGGFSFTMINVTALYHIISTDDSTSNFLTVSAGIGF